MPVEKIIPTAVAPAKQGADKLGKPQSAIRPYPKEWERAVTFGDNRKIFIRPIKPEDEALLRAFLKKVSRPDLRMRFFATIKEFSKSFIAHLTQLDYVLAMAFVAIDDASGEILGVVRLHTEADLEEGEFAILVRSDLKGHGLGWRLMELMIEYARSKSLKRIEGEVLAENTTMLEMCRELGFHSTTLADEPTLRRVKLQLE